MNADYFYYTGPTDMSAPVDEHRHCIGALRDEQAKSFAFLARVARLEEVLAGCRDALYEAGKDFALWNPRAVRPNLYELHAQKARAALAEKS